MDRTVPTGAELLLDFIRKTEVGRTDRASYDVIYGHNQNKLAKSITSLTIGELVDLQPSFTKRFKSSASGGYQFMRKTLQGLSRELDLSGKQLFDPDLQDRLGYHLLKRRGYEAFMAGQIGAVEFGRRLAMEWASFPVLEATKGAHRPIKRGQSYYTGDPLNKALVKLEAIEALLSQVKAASLQPITPLPDKPDVAVKEKPVTHTMRFLSWIASGGGAAALPFVDWRVQLFIAASIVGFAIYAIVTMPQIKAKIGKVVDAL